MGGRVPVVYKPPPPARSLPAPLAVSLFTRKSLADLRLESERSLLRRSLGPLNLTALGIGSIIGTGIFVLTGTAASQNPAPALVRPVIISAVGAAFAGLGYAEFAAMFPVPG